MAVKIANKRTLRNDCDRGRVSVYHIFEIGIKQLLYPDDFTKNSKDFTKTSLRHELVCVSICTHLCFSRECYLKPQCVHKCGILKTSNFEFCLFWSSWLFSGTQRCKRTPI